MEKNRVVYLDVLRIISIFAVIVIHVSSAYLRGSEIGTFDWNVSTIFNSVSRFCIPLFFMVSGAVFLDIKQFISINTMLNKYVKHILLILLVWGMIYYFFDLLIYNQTIGVKHFILFFLNLLSGNTGYHLWFLYELVGLYCVVPVLQIIVRNLDRKHLKYLVVLFLCFESCINYINNISASIPLISSYINIGFTLPVFTKYSLCFIMGYYLSHYKINDKLYKFIMYTAVLALLITPACNILFSILLSTEISVFSMDTGIFSITIAVFLFLYFKNKENSLSASRYKSVIVKLGEKNFGVYLIHVIFNSLLFHVIKINEVIFMNVLLSIIFYSLIVSCISLMSIMVLSKCKILSNFVR